MRLLFDVQFLLSSTEVVLLEKLGKNEVLFYVSCFMVLASHGS
jgi:hypothetical protein